MLLTTLMLVPVIGAVVVAALPSARETLAKQMALIFSIATLLGSLMVLLRLTGTGALELTESTPWISAFGISWSLGVDGISATLILMATILVPVVMVAGWWDAESASRGSVKGYFALILILEAFMIGVFAASDLFLFYVFFEAMLIPVYFLIGTYGGANRTKAATKFLLYSLVGGLFMLASLVALWVESKNQLGAGTFDYNALVGLDIDPAAQSLMFLGFFFAFAVKAPMVPFHTWLPDAAAEATPGTSTLLVGVLDKVGTFGMLHFCLALFPDASKQYTPIIVALALVSIFYGAIMALASQDMLRLVSYTSVSHFGFIVLGIFAMTSQGLSGSALYMVNHGFSTGAMFVVVGYLVARRGSKNISDFGGINKIAPVFAAVFLLSGLSSLALPGMSSFVSEFLVLAGTFSVMPVEAAIATLGIVFAALYILWLYQRTMTGEPSEEVRDTVVELRTRELVAIVPVIALILVLGVFPQLMLDVINPAVAHLQELIGVVDPSPAVDVVALAEGTVA